jgi:hypothetical protein
MKEGNRAYGKKHERKEIGRIGRRRWRGNLLRKFRLDRLTEGSR